jgi:deferrochelatase/peroxidase EfeB
VYAGSKRDDGRSWIDFHDGASNLAPGERLDAIAIPPTAHPDGSSDAWTSGGTYLAFMRLYIDLRVWRAVPTPKQEELVGRTKLSGLPLKSLPTTDRSSTFRDPGDAAKPPHEADQTRLSTRTDLDAALSASHIQRANHHNPYPGADANHPSANPMNHRIFRQGYPFLEPLSAPPGFRVGLNFVSFQATPANLTGMLNQAGWLGNTNFGGDTDPSKAVVVLSARAAGFFLVPPSLGAKRERFPGDHALTGASTPAPTPA